MTAHQYNATTRPPLDPEIMAQEVNLSISLDHTALAVSEMTNYGPGSGDATVTNGNVQWLRKPGTVMRTLEKYMIWNEPGQSSRLGNGAIEPKLDRIYEFV